jgi:hypothetical protein
MAKAEPGANRSAGIDKLVASLEGWAVVRFKTE